MSVDLKEFVCMVNDEIFNKQNIDLVEQVFCPTYIIHDTEKFCLSHSDIKDRLTGLLSNIPDLQVSVEPLIAKGDMVAWVRTQTGTPKDNSSGVPATGKKMRWISCYVSRVVDGRICEEWHSVNPHEAQM